LGMNFRELRHGEVHAGGVKVCIAHPDKASDAGEGMLISGTKDQACVRRHRGRRA
jgi:hypothetical protein